MRLVKTGSKPGSNRFDSLNMHESPHLIMNNVPDECDTFVTSQEANADVNEDINIDNDFDER